MSRAIPAVITVAKSIAINLPDVSRKLKQPSVVCLQQNTHNFSSHDALPMRNPEMCINETHAAPHRKGAAGRHCYGHRAGRDRLPSLINTAQNRSGVTKTLH